MYQPVTRTCYERSIEITDGNRFRLEKPVHSGVLNNAYKFSYVTLLRSCANNPLFVGTRHFQKFVNDIMVGILQSWHEITVHLS